jgi:hypothetical protein
MPVVQSEFDVERRGTGWTDYSINLASWGNTPVSGRDITVDIMNMATALTSIDKADLHDIVGVLANTDILPSALTPSNIPCVFRVMISLTVACIFRATIRKGANTQLVNFNSGIALNADSLYAFDMLVHDADTVNFQVSAGTNIRVLKVQELKGVG